MAKRCMPCQKCHGKVDIIEENARHVAIFGEEDHTEKTIPVLSCNICDVYVGLKWNDEWFTAEDILCTGEDVNHLQQLETLWDKIVLFVLVKVESQQMDPDPDFKVRLPGPHEKAKILWRNGVAEGFYTYRPKGTQYSSLPLDVYEMTVIDMIYVRKDYRKQGLASVMLEDVFESHPEQNVGLSKPVSPAMMKVLSKFLAKHPTVRDFCWAIVGTGHEGDRENIWLSIPSRKRKISDLTASVPSKQKSI